jgi:hypothetical protein
MLVELVAPDRLRRVVGQALRRREPTEPHPSFSSESERAKRRREAYARGGYTYVGNVHLGPQDSSPYRGDWSFQKSAPVRPPNPESNIADGDPVLGTGDYLTVFFDPSRRKVLWEGTLRFYPDGRGYRHPLGVEEEYFLRLFSDGCPAELRTPTLATAGETVRVNNTVFWG